MELLKLLKTLTVQPKNAQELKGVILQLAVQGKLTKKWRNNNKVEVLISELSNIVGKAEKEIKETHNNIKELDLPETWLKTKFKLLFDMKGGSQPPKSKFIYEEAEGYVQLFQIRDFGNRPKPVYVPIDSVSKFCSKGDILIGRYGASIGKVFYGKNGAYNVALIKLIWNENIFIQDYVYQLFLSPLVQGFFESCTRSAQAGFNKSDIGEVSLPIPPLEEQKEIVRIVTQLLKQVDTLQEQTQFAVNLKEDYVTAILRKLTQENAQQTWQELIPQFKAYFTTTESVKKLRASVLQLAVQGKLTKKWRQENIIKESAVELLEKIKAEKAQLIKEKKIKKEKPLPAITPAEIPFEIPESWEWCRFGEYALCERGRFSIRPRNDPRYFDGNIPYIQIRDLNNKGYRIKHHNQTLNELGLKASKLFQKDTVVIAIVGATIGNSGLLDYEMCFPDSLIGIQPTSKNNTEYINYLFISKKQYFRDISYAGGGQPNIKNTTINELLISLPPLEEQKAIVQKVNELMRLCDALEEIIKQNTQQSHDLMQSCIREIS